jgi:hypothetical protein
MPVWGIPCVGVLGVHHKIKGVSHKLIDVLVRKLAPPVFESGRKDSHLGDDQWLVLRLFIAVIGHPMPEIADQVGEEVDISLVLL